MNNNDYLSIINKKQKEEIAKIVQCNTYTEKYGLTLTPEQIKNIVEKRNETLKDTSRIEFGNWVIDKIIIGFCDSPYISQYNYSETLYQIIEMFYHYKNETMDLITDDELIKFMKENFDGIAQGDIDYLEGTVLDKMAKNVLAGKPMDYNFGSDDENE